MEYPAIAKRYSKLAIGDHYCPVVLIGKRSKCIERNAKRTKLIVADLKISHL
jgi:hypothetical protein